MARDYWEEVRREARKHSSVLSDADVAMLRKAGTAAADYREREGLPLSHVRDAFNMSTAVRRWTYPGGKSLAQINEAERIFAAAYNARVSRLMDEWARSFEPARTNPKGARHPDRKKYVPSSDPLKPWTAKLAKKMMRKTHQTPGTARPGTLHRRRKNGSETRRIVTIRYKDGTFATKTFKASGSFGKAACDRLRRKLKQDPRVKSVSFTAGITTHSYGAH